MACCGRGKRNFSRNIHPKAASKAIPKVPRIGKKTCTKCGGSLQLMPNKVLIGNQMLNKNKCTSCGSLFYFL